MQQITDEQIEQFLKGESLPEEAKQIAAYLRAHPEHPHLLQEWRQTEDKTALPEGVKEKMFEAIQAETRPKQGLLRRLPLRWIAAASVLLLMGGVWFWQRKEDSGKNKVGNTQENNIALKKIAYQNNTDTMASILLPDSSLVLLYPGSTLHYNKSMGLHTRDIELEGKASFDVAKDPAKPFTVWAKGFTTTALGTKFIVDAEKKEGISIQLLRGKVVVKVVEVNRFPMSNVYLKPGQELSINIDTRDFLVKNMIETSPVAKKTKIDSTRNTVVPSLQEAETVNGMNFNKNSLALVFRQLEKYYNVKIIYNEKEVQGLTFKGSFTTADSLDLAIRTICNMNGLTYKESQDTVFIIK